MNSLKYIAAIAVLSGLGPCGAALAKDPQAPPAPPGGEQSGSTVPAPPSAEEVAALRREIEDLKRQIQTLRDQIRAGLLPDRGPGPAPGAAGTSGAPAAAPSPPGEAAPPAPAPEAPPAQQPTSFPAGTAGAAPTRIQSLLNPAISAILQAAGTTSLERQSDANGFDLSEAEIAFQSAVDPFTRVDLFLTFTAGETPEVEEGTVTTLSLPGPLQLKGGRFKNAFGKWNTQHDHQFFSVDRPNALVHFFGDESLTTDGLSLSVLIPNPWDQYIDALTEIGTALEGPGFNSDRRHLTWLEHLAWFFNTGPNSTLEFGATAARGRTGPSEALLDDLAACADPACVALQPRSPLPSGVRGIDVTYKWKPVRLNVYRSFLWQTEALRSRRHLDVLTPAFALEPDVVTAGGGYSHVEWQFAKRWRVGARYDWSDLPDDEAARERAASAIVRYQPSEFQEIRFQYKRTRRNDEAAARFDGETADSQLFFEWIPVIGAHGAHKY